MLSAFRRDCSFGLPLAQSVSAKMGSGRSSDDLGNAPGKILGASRFARLPSFIRIKGMSLSKG